MRSRPELHGTYGTVSSTHWLASAAGAAAFDRGGNAFDAAATAAFVIQVVEPHLNGPAGDVPIMVYDAATEEVKVVCGQGPMPAAATVDAFRERGLAEVPGSGLLPACVPGAFGAWMRLVQQYGRLPIADVLAPAIGYAEDGYPSLPKASAMINALAPLFREEWTESGATYLDRGRAPKPGARVRNPALAQTYRRILDEARGRTSDREAQAEAAVDVFYQGFVAEAIDKFMATAKPIDSTGSRNAGLLTGSDLAAWRPTVEDPVNLSYRGYLVYKPGPWSQGPVFLQQLALLEGYDLRKAGFGTADHIHTVVECAKLAFADREAWYGDPDHADVPLAALLDPAYSAARRSLVGGTPSGVLRPGEPEGRTPWVPPIAKSSTPPDASELLAELGEGIPGIMRLTTSTGDTTCISATDRDGNLVVATPSGGWLKSSPVVPALGFPLGTRGQMALLTEGHNNVLAPGKRPRTTLSPTIVRTDDGRPYLAFGTPGGDQQDQWTLNFFVNHVDFGMSPQEAVEAASFHSEHVPTSFTPRQANPLGLVVEADIPEATTAELRRRGHKVRVVAAMSLGKVCATGHGPQGGVLAAASPRGEQAYGVAR